VTTRTHFAYRIDLWTDDEKEVVAHLADVDDLAIALATYHAACKRWPGKAITLRQGPHVIEDNRRSRLATLFSFPCLTSHSTAAASAAAKQAKL
jgi:hypothetical protein